MALIEILAFQLAAGVDDDEFLRADRAVQDEFVPFLPGFIRRTTARGDGGQWLVVTLWGSAADADACERAAKDHPAAAALAALLDSSSVRSKRYTTLD